MRIARTFGGLLDSKEHGCVEDQPQAATFETTRENSFRRDVTAAWLRLAFSTVALQENPN